MDPLSIAATAASLIGISVRLGQSLSTLRAKFRKAQQTLAALCSECSTTTAGLHQLQQLMLTRPDIFGSSTQSQQHLLECFRTTMINMAQTFSVLDGELEKLAVVGNPPDRLGYGTRLRFMWVEDDLKEINQAIRDQRDALSFLIGCIQLTKLSDIDRNLRTESPGLEALRRTATRAKAFRPTPRTTPPTAGSCADDLESILKNNDPSNFPAPDAPQDPQSPPPTSPLPTSPSRAKARDASNSGRPPPRPQTTSSTWPGSGQRTPSGTLVHHGLHLAVTENNVERVLQLLASGSDPLALPINPYKSLPNASKTPLCVAALLGREQILRIFLERGAGIALNEKIGNDLPPLLAASYAGHEGVVRMLLDAGADISLQGPGKNTSLFWAATRGNISVIRLLLDCGARPDIHLKNEKGLTPLMAASQLGQQDVVELLINEGSDIHVQNHKLQSAIHLAAHKGSASTVRALLDCQASLNGLTDKGKTPIIFAAASGHLDVVNLLLERGAALDLQDIDGRTPLYHAASAGHTTVVEKVLDHKASTEINSQKGDNSLHIACEKGHDRVVRLLLHHGAQFESTRSEDKYTPLHVAAYFGQAECARLLLLVGANANAKCLQQATPLYYAARNGNSETVDVLLEAGADLEAVDSNGQTLLGLAVREASVEAVTCLLAKGASVRTADKYGAAPLHRAARASNKTLATHLLAAGADIEVEDKGGHRPIHIAAIYGSTEMVGYLLCEGAMLESLSSAEQSPLMVAAANERVDILKTLLRNGAWLGPYEEGCVKPIVLITADGWAEVVEETIIQRCQVMAAG